MFRLGLFRIRAFTFGTLSSFLAAVGRGGLMFMLIIWLQGIWLPEHGYSFTSTPLWAGIYMIPLTVGFLLAGPLSGFLSDRFGSRPFATGGMIGAAASFAFLQLLPIDFPVSAVRADPLPQRAFDGRVRITEPRGGHEQPAPRRPRRGRRHERDLPELGAGALHRHLLHADDHRAGGTLSTTMTAGLEAHGVPAAVAQHVGHLPPVSILFAAFLGYNPIQSLVGAHVLSHLSAANASALTGRQFFPELISGPFAAGLHQAFTFSLVVCLIAAVASWSRGRRVASGQPAIASEAPGALTARI